MVDFQAIVVSIAVKSGLAALWSKIRAWFRRHPVRGVLIIGPGGVGKTTLANCLSGKKDKRKSGIYTETISTEDFELDEKSGIRLVIPPGQLHRRDSTWAPRLDEVAKGKFRGVILIHAYGHHALGDISYKNHKLFNENDGLEEFAAKYIDDCIKKEEQVLKKVCDAVKKCAAPIWLLTLVTKQDLWWSDRDKVEQHYKEGKYGKIIAECLGSKDERSFRHEIAWVSLIIRNLVTGRNETIRKNVSGYDSLAQEESVEKMLQVFSGLISWEKEHGV